MNFLVLRGSSQCRGSDFSGFRDDNKDLLGFSGCGCWVSVSPEEKKDVLAGFGLGCLVFDFLDEEEPPDSLTVSCLGGRSSVSLDEKNDFLGWGSATAFGPDLFFLEENMDMIAVEVDVGYQNDTESRLSSWYGKMSIQNRTGMGLHI